jgi:hypothetical protein
MKRWLFPLVCICCPPLTGQVKFGREPANTCSLVDSDRSHRLDVTAFIHAYNYQTQKMLSLHLDAMLRVSAGSDYGVPGHLPELPATVDFVSPALVRLSVPFPLTGARGFELTGDARRYSLLVPGLGGRTFFTGPVDAPARSSKPTENLRPLMLIEALRWPKAIPADGAPTGSLSSSGTMVLKLVPLPDRTESRTAKIKLDPDKGTVSSLVILNSSGQLLSETNYAAWHRIEDSPDASEICLPGTISIIQPGTPDSITLRILRVEWNATIPQRLFQPDPPKGVPIIYIDASGTLSSK